MNALVLITILLLALAIIAMIFCAIMGERKLYMVTYQKTYTTHTTVVEAKDKFQAIKKIHKMCNKYDGCIPTIININKVC